MTRDNAAKNFPFPMPPYDDIAKWYAGVPFRIWLAIIALGIVWGLV